MSHILFVSDNPDLKETNMDYFIQNNYEVSTSPDCLSGLLNTGNGSFDIVVIDEQISDMNCYKCCQKVQQHSNIPIVLLGSSLETEIWPQKDELGFDLYIKKPVVPQELLAQIRALMKRTLPVKHTMRLETGEPAVVLATSTTPALLQYEETAVHHKQTEDERISLDKQKEGPVIKLIQALATKRLPEIIPTINLTSVNGFSYPEVDRLLETSGQDTLNILDSLARKNVLIKHLFEKIKVDPEASSQLIPIERCPYCGSGNLIKGQLLEHLSCGYSGLDQDYRSDGGYNCPKCHKNLKLVGADYRNAGIYNKCLDCNEITRTPSIKWRSLRTGKIWSTDELHEIMVYSYSLNPEKRGWLEFQLKSKNQLVELLELRGYQVKESAQLSGSSGAIHTVDILATRDDKFLTIDLGIGILVASPGESKVQLDELFKFDTSTYDSELNYKVVVAIPELSIEAVNFAKRQMIGVFEADSLEALVSYLISKQHAKIEATADTEHSREQNDVHNIVDRTNAQSEIVKFLKQRDYKVFVNAKITGKSGADYIFDIFAQRDDGVVVPNVVIGIATAKGGEPIGIEEVSKFDAEAYDAGIRNKVFIGIPDVSNQAKQFARQQRIEVLQLEQLSSLLSQ